MSEIPTVTTLRSKRDEIVHSIRLYERQLEQARADMVHVTAAIRIFEASGNTKDMAHYVDTHRLWHEADVPQCPLFGRYRGISGRGADIVKTSKMTQSRHV